MNMQGQHYHYNNINLPNFSQPPPPCAINGAALPMFSPPPPPPPAIPSYYPPAYPPQTDFSLHCGVYQPMSLPQPTQTPYRRQHQATTYMRPNELYNNKKNNYNGYVKPSHHQQFVSQVPANNGNCGFRSVSSRNRFNISADNYHSAQQHDNQRSFFHHQNNKRQWNDENGNVPHRNKKKKIDKRDLPENNKFFCDICDRGFKTNEKYQEHVKGHVKCNVPGCTYVAAVKLVQLHFQFQHRTGLAEKIWQLDSKHEIDKWRDERRRNFPTKENMERKAEEKRKRIERGDVLDNKRFGKCRYDNRRGRWRQQGWISSRENFTNSRPSPPPSNGKSKSSAAESMPTAVDDHNKNEGPSLIVNTESVVTPQDEFKSPKSQSMNCTPKRPARPKVIPKRQLTFLERLLAPDIRHERNVLLQCIRYILHCKADRDEVQHITAVDQDSNITQ